MKDSKYKVVIIILLVVIVCLGGYIVYDAINDKNNQIKDNEVNENNSNTNNNETIGENNNNNNNNNSLNDSNINNNQTNNQNTVVKYDLDKAEKLLSKYYFGEDYYGGFVSLSSTRDKLYAAIRNSPKKQMSCSEAYSGNKEYRNYEESSAGQIESEGHIFDCDEKPAVIIYSELNSQYRKLFGSNQSIPKKNLTYGLFVWYYYDKANDRFIESTFPGGGTGELFNFYSIKTAEIINDELVIKIRYAEVYYLFESDLWEVELEDGRKVQIKGTTEEEKRVKQEINSKYKDQLKIKTFTFVLDNGNYVLKNIEG